MSESNLKHVIVYTDGACIGNPGPGGYGAVLQYGNHYREISKGFKLTTNNRMELMAAIAAFEALKTKCMVTLCTDSQLLANSLTEGWVQKWQSKGWKRGRRSVLNADLSLTETDPYKNSNNSALLTSRAAVYCDKGEWVQAKKTIGRALAIQKSDEAFNVVKRIKTARPEQYK